MSNIGKRKHQIIGTLAPLVAASLFSAAVATSALSHMAAFAQPSNGAAFKGNVSGSVISEQGKEQPDWWQ